MTAAAPVFAFDHSYARDLEGLYEPWRPQQVPSPELLVLNVALAGELGLDPAALASPEGVAVLAGNAVPETSRPIALAYAGHQFGNYSPRLGDGRALLLGELIDVQGRRRDLHLKGSGRTTFSRGGDGKAAVGPMLREHLIGEAMHALGIPTTRALAVVATGEQVARDTLLPGAVLARVASSHLRVGSFEYAAATGDLGLLQRLADHAIARHAPEAAAAEQPVLALLARIVEVQADLVARWMLVGFVHGVMNTDNTTISGETIDYGPCAFMDGFDLATVFSSIDHGGRYAYGNQPRILLWNLSRLAEALLPLIDADPARAVAPATEVLQAFGPRYLGAWRSGMAAKLGLTDTGTGTGPEVGSLVDDTVELLQAHRVDHTLFFRHLARALRGDEALLREMFAAPAAPAAPGSPTAFDVWLATWRSALGRGTGQARAGGDAAVAVADAMDGVNPLYIPRNHLVDEALAAASAGDLDAYLTLIDVVTDPFAERPGMDAYARPAPAGGAPHRTFCGT